MIPLKALQFGDVPAFIVSLQKTAPGGQPFVLRKVEDRTRSQTVWGPRWSQPTNILRLKPATSLGMAGMAGMAQIYDSDFEIA